MYSILNKQHHGKVLLAVLIELRGPTLEFCSWTQNLESRNRAFWNEECRSNRYRGYTEESDVIRMGIFTGRLLFFFSHLMSCLLHDIFLSSNLGFKQSFRCARTEKSINMVT